MQIVRNLLVALAACTLFAAAPVTAQSKTTKVDINRASAAELMAALEGVGEKRAAAIVKHRKKSPFKTTDDLLQVPGIGPAIIAKNFRAIGLPRGKRTLDGKSASDRVRTKPKAVKASARKGKSKAKNAVKGKLPTRKPSIKKPAKGKATTKKPSVKKPTKVKKPSVKKRAKVKKPSIKKPAKVKKPATGKARK